MFRKLRIQFIAIIMASVAVVLVVVFSGICMAEYQRGASEVEQALTNAIERVSDDRSGFHQGPLGMPRSEGGEEYSNRTGSASGATDSKASPESSTSRGLADSTISDKTGDAPDGDVPDAPQIGKRDERSRSIVPVAVYSITETSTLKAVTGFTTASIDSDVLATAASRVGEIADGSGTLADLGLHYKKKTTESTTYVAFADTSTTETWQQLALTLGIAGLGTLAVFFVISLFFSKWALKPVQEAWESQRQFVADTSHDLKTPLTVILANSSILLKHPDRSIASESQWIESTQIEAQNMQGLVNEMLELAQVEAGQAKQGAAHEPIDFSDLADGETLMFDSIALERGCSFNCAVDEGISVMGDRQQLHKMTATLLENAFKYVDAGGTVDVSLRQAGRHAVLSIRNTGSVVSPEDLPHIFDRFYRTDKARTSGAGGFGLGLAIARGIAQSHGGDIACTSTEQTGTTFTVTLPIAR